MQAFRIPLGAVDHYIVAKFTPMTPDGEAGEPAYVISEKTVESMCIFTSFINFCTYYFYSVRILSTVGRRI